MGLFQGPPLRLDVIVIDCYIGFIPVQPHSQGFEFVHHLVLVVQGEFPAFVDKVIDAHLLDLLLVLDAQCPFHLDLYWQAVHVESSLVADIVLLHSAKADYGILQNLVPCSAEMDVARCVWRAIYEVESLAFLAVLFYLLIGVFLLPQLLDVLFQCGWFILFGNLMSHP